MKQRDLVLVEMPFSNHLETKIRPAVIVSNNSYNQTHEDVLVCGLTSNPIPREYSIPVTVSDTNSGNLPKPSRIRVDQTIFFQKGVIINVFDQLSESKFDEVVKQLHLLIKRN